MSQTDVKIMQHTHMELTLGMLALYERVIRRVQRIAGISMPIHSPIEVKQGCPLSLTLFGLYIAKIFNYIS